MKKRKTTTNRIPPSIPKCVTKYENGYITGFVQSPHDKTDVRFIFRKTEKGYSVSVLTANSPAEVNMTTDHTLSPTTRSMFWGIGTLKNAIKIVQEWIGRDLPDIR